MVGIDVKKPSVTHFKFETFGLADTTELRRSEHGCFCLSDMCKKMKTATETVLGAIYLAGIRCERRKLVGVDLFRAYDVLLDVVHLDMLPRINDNILKLTEEQQVMVWNKIRYARTLVSPHSFEFTQRIKDVVLAHRVIRKRPHVAPRLVDGVESIMANKIVEYLYPNLLHRSIILQFILLQEQMFHALRRSTDIVDGVELSKDVVAALSDSHMIFPDKQDAYDLDLSIRGAVLLDVAFDGEFLVGDSTQGFLESTLVHQISPEINVVRRVYTYDLFRSRLVPSPATDYHPNTLLSMTIAFTLALAFKRVSDILVNDPFLHLMLTLVANPAT